MGWRHSGCAHWRTSVSINSDSERKSSGLMALQCAFPQLQHDGIAVRHAQYPKGWWHHDEPSCNYKMAASRCAITFRRKSKKVQEELNMIHYPRAVESLCTRLRAEESSDFKMAASRCAITFRRKSGRVHEELEFKKSSTWSTILGLRHVYLLVCGRKSQVTSSRHIVVCLFAKDLVKLVHICTCVFLIYDILEYVYPSARDKKFSVQLDPYLVQRTYTFVSIYLN